MKAVNKNNRVASPLVEDNRKRQQYEFIELVLAYEGLITNQRVREHFSVSNVHASRLIAGYRELFPKNIEILSGEGRGKYTVTSRFKAQVAKLSIARYFKVAGSSGAHVETESVQYDLTNIAPEKFRTIHSAIVHKKAVKLLYRSMSTPSGAERIIHPKALVFAGRRWHVRAYDERNGEYRDFNLARMESLFPTDTEQLLPADESWNNYVKLHLVAHPTLLKEQSELIRDELFEGATSRVVTVRDALVNYVLRELEVSTDADTQTPPEYQVFLKRVERKLQE
ncbi:helix-turn-helix transcriptional regulator [Alteromonas sp. a30]|uniref:helix-turn-helix transcriptional regulator n=1 Tax=Alteromonas sp. a30 TaxID=2730917 RepID=UPI002281AB03|nr:WYL domain-containing protein [Alteromonas sp. a30]MCY7296232.1 WYL domain-containing protein [Alteromonas sp. a30]